MALTPLTGVTPDVGSSFSLLIDSTAGAAVVNLSSVSGASSANIDSASQKIAYRLNPSCTGADCKLTIGLQTGGPAGSDDPLFLILRGVDSNNFYMLAVYQLAKVGADFSICKVQAGVASILATAGTDVGVTGSETIAFQCTGTTLTGYVNGVSKVTTTDSTFAAAGFGAYGLGSILNSADDIALAWSFRSILLEEEPPVSVTAGFYTVTLICD